jgi:hypothetical protein
MKVLTVLALLFLSGCSTGFDRGALKERLAGEALQVDDADIKAALELKPQLRFPIRLGVFLIADSYNRPVDYDWRWSVEDKRLIDSWAEPLKSQGIVSDLFVISEVPRSRTDLRSIRLAAARHGADAVLVIQGVSQVDAYVNPLCLLNVLILPGWVVPASHRDALLVTRGAMWDVGNQFLYLTVEAEGVAKTVRPTFRASSLEAIDRAKGTALRDFGPELLRRFGSLKGPEIRIKS